MKGKRRKARMWVWMHGSKPPKATDSIDGKLVVSATKPGRRRCTDEDGAVYDCFGDYVEVREVPRRKRK